MNIKKGEVNMNFFDWRVILEVTNTATFEEVKASYRRLAKKHHPDVGGRKENARN